MQMDSIRIKGDVRLQGKVRIQGSKNAALPVLAATLLTKGENVLYNCPKISDIYQMKQLLKCMGCVVKEHCDSVSVNAEQLRLGRLPAEAVQGMRSSVCMLGALLGRCYEVTMEYPGGCVIGARPIDMHLEALEKMGATFQIRDGLIHAKINGRFRGTDIHFRKTSVGATENTILAAVLAEGRTCIYGAAKEPEVTCLCQYLNDCGARIEGLGSDNLIITGVNELQGCITMIPADRIVAGTYLFATLAVGGSVFLEEAPCHEMESVIQVAEEMGAICQVTRDGLYVQREGALRAVEMLKTGEYPAFPTDLQSLFLVTATNAEGTSYIEETIFENRFHIVEPLQKMGGQLQVLDERRVCVSGPVTLSGKEVEAKELRGGAALVVAGLMAKGTMVVRDCKYIARGYENICRDLRELGARVTSE